jgi:hypothetical protein
VIEHTSQLNECSRQCSRPVLAQCSMGFGPNPLINGLILHTKSKLNYENHIKKIGHELNCDEFDCVGTDLSIKKHVNNKHSIKKH